MSQFMGSSLRMRLVAVVSLVLIFVLAGCSSVNTSLGRPSAPPQPEKNDIEQAIAEAKQTYRDYSAAVGQIDMSNQSTIDAVLAFVTGEQFEADFETYETVLNEDGTIDGTPVITFLEAADGATLSRVVLHSCVASTELHFFTADGEETLTDTKTRIFPIDATLIATPDGSWLVQLMSHRSDEPTRNPAGTDIDAAKQVYLEYNTASSKVRVDDRSTWARTEAFTTDSRDEDDRRINEKLSELGWIQTGLVEVISVELVSLNENQTTMVLRSCLDNSDVNYFDMAGKEQRLDGPTGLSIPGIILVRESTSSSWLVDDLVHPPDGATCSR